ncbi:MAG TPA: phosphate signaling complex protein PhoU [Terriglobia bacterium]|nr:phosphate signaling complex protein PhoU [Terriglobia bacterium]
MRALTSMSHPFEEQLDELKNRMLFMGSLVEHEIHLSIQAMCERDEQPAMRVIAEIEPQVNDLHLELDVRALQLLSLQQPLAADLRFITSTMKINSDLERIGNQAVNIAQRALSIVSQPELKPLVDIPLMADIVKKMVKDALDAFVQKNTDLARDVVLRDDEVDQYRDLVFRELVPLMAKNSACIQLALDLIRNLERIADHATNVAEDVIYMVLGRDIRHRAEERVLPK